MNLAVTMTEIVIPYAPRPLQLQLHAALQRKRWGVVVCHRRFGKTVWAINHLLKAALTTPNNARFAYFAPFLKQAKSIAWDYLKHFSRPIPGININETELRVDYPNGSRIRLIGADNPDSQRGVYLDGAVLDEYAQMQPSLFTEILRPALSDRKGWCVWMGTPKGRNQFYDIHEKAKNDPAWHVALYKASETGILDAAELASARQMMSADEYDQEYECSWIAALKGAYFSTELAAARTAGRIGKVPHQPNANVSTWWDLGMDDSTAIWFTQDAGREIHIIDYYEASGEGLAHYRDVLNKRKDERGYRYGTHYGPHDLAVRELGNGKSRVETAQDMGLKFEVVPRVEHKADAIQAARNLLGHVWIDETRCARGIVCLESYRKEWDDKLGVFRDKPLHDWASHGADALMTLARGHKFAVALRQASAQIPTAAGWT
jgi:phage terminase large subunit